MRKQREKERKKEKEKPIKDVSWSDLPHWAIGIQFPWEASVVQNAPRNFCSEEQEAEVFMH